ncbi:MAG: pyridoxamine 5'-phosphate oxidase family protein [Deltaproteobacteria bacterium]|nr:pyridoxamine 5'-phosphate oxidase family protein [Deltaproteobacteria bacterium]MBW2392713.1 pyridoxamine 5'-phosphate oxidase family protein [Deltaproteobacteria bacterium]
MSLNMSQTQREAFLMDLHVGIIGIERQDAAPLCVPIWYDYTPEKGLWVLTSPESQKGQALATAGRFSLCAQTEAPPYQYVSVEGAITETRPAELERDSRPMAHRYLGKEFGDQYVANSGNDDSLVFVITPERWRTVDYSKLGS